MDKDGYPDDGELEKIEKWDWHDAIGLIQFITDRWAYNDWGVKQKWAKDTLLKRVWVLHLELHTAGWSGNESLIHSLMKNHMALAVLNYRMWKAGGHYWFEYNPAANGFKTVSAFCKEKGITRQAIHKCKEKYIWLDAGPKIKMIKPYEKM